MFREKLMLAFEKAGIKKPDRPSNVCGVSG